MFYTETLRTELGAASQGEKGVLNPKIMIQQYTDDARRGGKRRLERQHSQDGARLAHSQHGFNAQHIQSPKHCSVQSQE